MNNKSPFDNKSDQQEPTPAWGSYQPPGQHPTSQFPLNPTLIVAVVIGFVMVAGVIGYSLYAIFVGETPSAPAKGTTQLGADADALQAFLHADPRYKTSRVAMEVRNDASGGLVEWVEIILPDSQCPAPDAAACASVIDEAVRVMLNAPTIHNHPGIIVTLQSFMPGPPHNGVPGSPGKPPLAEHTLGEWRALLNVSESAPSTPAPTPTP